MSGGTVEDHDNCHYFRLGGRILTVTLGFKWEVSVLVSSCYVRLGTACFKEVRLTEGR